MIKQKPSKSKTNGGKKNASGAKAATDKSATSTRKLKRYSDKLGEEICSRIADNESLRSICKSPKMPNAKTVYRWIKSHPEFARQYILAHDDQADATYEDIIAIETDLRAGIIDAPTARVLIDSHKWRAGKMRPKKYGDASALRISGEDGGPVQVEDVSRGIDLSKLDAIINNKDNKG
jgi:hypothetical protein